MDSAKAGVIEVGTMIDAVETAINDAGVLRIHFSGGWVQLVECSSVHVLFDPSSDLCQIIRRMP